jgi:hypothetical protein
VVPSEVFVQVVTGSEVNVGVVGCGHDGLDVGIPDIELQIDKMIQVSHHRFLMYLPETRQCDKSGEISMLVREKSFLSAFEVFSQGTVLCKWFGALMASASRET